MSIQTETIVDRNTVSETWGKRTLEEDDDDDVIEEPSSKRQKFYYLCLGSESSPSENDTESVYSLQDRTTDVVRDTSDTDADCSLSGYELEMSIEYEVATISDVDSSYRNSSSGDEDIVLAAAAAIVNNSVETFITDGEESDTSSIEETSFGRTDFRVCVQCKSENDNPCYRYCKKCFQDRKTFYPPRPRRNRRIKTIPKAPSPTVKLDTLRNCLSGMSQDSGIGSSQECPPLDLHQIVVPKHLQDGPSSSLSSSISISPINNVSTDSLTTVTVDTDLDLKNRKRQFSESSLSEYEISKPKRIRKNLPSIQKIQNETHTNINAEGTKFADNSNNNSDTLSKLSDSGLCSSSIISDSGSKATDAGLGSSNSTPKSSEVEISSSSGTREKDDALNNGFSETQQLCMVCNETPRNGIFIHGSIAHMCCCYKCAIKTWKTIKRCPLCNRRVNNVVKLYT